MLTEQELTVLRLRKSGKTQVQIAKELSISQAAVSKFERNAERKLIEAEQLLALAKSEGIRVEKNTTGKRIKYREGSR